jgi:ATP-dependent Lon protease
VCIAQTYLVPRQRQANGLDVSEIRFTDEALHKIIRDYTREAGVRNLERQIGAVCRKLAVQIAAHETAPVTVTPEQVQAYLKQERFISEVSKPHEIPGIATGLAVTAVGGDILFIEATRMKGKGGLTLIGHLGEVMRESAQLAHSYVRSMRWSWASIRTCSSGSISTCTCRLARFRKMAPRPALPWWSPWPAF